MTGTDKVIRWSPPLLFNDVAAVARWFRMSHGIPALAASQQVLQTLPAAS